jgi:quinol monooxygenase YgiN
MEIHKLQQKLLLILIIVMATFFSSDKASAQINASYMRIASITVNSASLEKYKAALKEQMNAALQLEPGVLAYSAVYHKNNPAQITILETYASVAAYEAHIQIEHFKKYKATVADMVTSLELIDVVPIAVETKVK